MSFSDSVLPALYGSAMRVTRRHGALTPDRLIHCLFPNCQYFYSIPMTASSWRRIPISSGVPSRVTQIAARSDALIDFK